MLYKNTNHQQMHEESFIINCNTLLHVSTLLLQGQLFVTVTLRLPFSVGCVWGVVGGVGVAVCRAAHTPRGPPPRRPARNPSHTTPPKTTQYTVNSTISLNYKVQP
jgi:hypothetical protein